MSAAIGAGLRYGALGLPLALPEVVQAGPARFCGRSDWQAAQSNALELLVGAAALPPDAGQRPRLLGGAGVRGQVVVADDRRHMPADVDHRDRQFVGGVALHQCTTHSLT